MQLKIPKILMLNLLSSVTTARLLLIRSYEL